MTYIQRPVSTNPNAGANHHTSAAHTATFSFFRMGQQ